MKNKFKKNDIVKIISGENIGRISKIVSFFPKVRKVLVTGVNIVKRNIKPNKTNLKGSVITKEMPIHMSNIMHVDSKTNLVSRIGIKLSKYNKKLRFLKKSGKFIDGENE